MTQAGDWEQLADAPDELGSRLALGSKPALCDDCRPDCRCLVGHQVRSSSSPAAGEVADRGGDPRRQLVPLDRLTEEVSVRRRPVGDGGHRMQPVQVVEFVPAAPAEDMPAGVSPAGR